MLIDWNGGGLTRGGRLNIQRATYKGRKWEHKGKDIQGGIWNIEGGDLKYTGGTNNGWERGGTKGEEQKRGG